MNETQEQLDVMPIEQLETLVSEQGHTEEAPVDGKQDTSTATTGESVGKSETETGSAPDEAPPKWFVSAQENLKRELGSLRKNQSAMDKLPQMIERQIEQRLARLQQQQNLSPEDRQNQEQLQTQQEQLDAYISKKATEVFGKEGGQYIGLLNEMKEQRQDSNHRNAVMEMASQVLPESAQSEEAWNSIFEQSYKDIMANKPGALERQERLEKDPAFVAFSMVQAQRSRVQGQAQQVTQTRTDQARAASQGVKTATVSNAGKKPVSEMSQKELDGLSIAELEEAIPES